jgi:hypothetical protein
MPGRGLEGQGHFFCRKHSAIEVRPPNIALKFLFLFFPTAR